MNSEMAETVKEMARRDEEQMWKYIRGSPQGAEYAKKTNMCYI